MRPSKILPRVRASIRCARIARKLRGATRLHLACGKNVMDGWSNIDQVDDGEVIGWDLTKKLPVRSIELIYCEHFIEHIGRDSAKALLRECRRVLRSDGVLRISTPDLAKLIAEYQIGRTSEWSDSVECRRHLVK